MMRTAAIIAAGGFGTRAGGAPAKPKQLEMLAGKTLLDWSVEAFGRHPSISDVVLVLPDAIFAARSGARAVAGGPTRQASVRNGLEALAAEPPDCVLIHDAARPLISAALIGRVIEALDRAPAVLPVTPVTDTLKQGAVGGLVAATVPREGLWRAQTPQGFRFGAILSAHRDFAGGSFTDDAAIAEAAGIPVTLIEGDPRNIKITVREDFAMAEALIGAGPERVLTITGQGFDVHRLVPGDGVWLCGIKIPGPFALLGHSDADCALHAITDAILGAIAAGDIGMHFSPHDDLWKGSPSDHFLSHAMKLLAEAGGRLLHVDVTIVCERPHIAPHREAMRRRVAEIAGLALGRVSVKATTTEGLGFTGRKEGIAAQAIATIALPEPGSTSAT